MDLVLQQHFAAVLVLSRWHASFNKNSALHPLFLPDSMQCMLFFEAYTEHLCLRAAKVFSSGPFACKRASACTQRLQLTTVLAVQCCWVGVFHVTCVPSVPCTAEVQLVKLSFVSLQFDLDLKPCAPRTVVVTMRKRFLRRKGFGPISRMLFWPGRSQLPGQLPFLRMLKLQAPLVWTTWLLVGEKNAARGLKRKMLNGSHSPDFYYADIELHDPKLEENREVSLPFLLPNEIAGKLFEFGDPTWILSRQVLQEDAELIEKFSSSCQPARDPATVLPLGLWNDGVPCNWDRSQSLEVIALSFPSIPGLRVPLFCLKKMFEAKKCSMDAALKVLVWSFEQLAVGRYRSRRHDGSPFDARVDKARIRLAGLELPSACLTQIRGDWKMFKDTLSLPAHNERNGCCWICPMTPDKVHEVGLEVLSGSFQIFPSRSSD